MKFPVFDVADGLPMNARDFRKALLRHVGFGASRFHVRPDEPQHLTFGHAALKNRNFELQT